MTDIVEWLRSDCDWPTGTKAGMRKAADEIERLTAELREPYRCRQLPITCPLVNELGEEIERLQALVRLHRGAIDTILRTAKACQDNYGGDGGSKLPSEQGFLGAEHLVREE